MSGREADEGGYGFSPGPEAPSPPAPALRGSSNDPRSLKLPKMIDGIDRNLCHIGGCGTDLTQLREYHQRFRLCDLHLKASAVLKDGIAQRFCQQCGRFHPLDEFDGAKRSCRARLLRHNARRRRKTVSSAGATRASFGSGGEMPRRGGLAVNGAPGQLPFPFDHHPLPWLMDNQRGEGLRHDMEEGVKGEGEGEGEYEDDEGYEGAYQGEDEEMRAGYVEENPGGGGEQAEGQPDDFASWPGTITMASSVEAWAEGPRPPQPPPRTHMVQHHPIERAPRQGPAEDLIQGLVPEPGMVIIDGVGCEMQDSKIQDAIATGVPGGLKSGPTASQANSNGFSLIPLASSLLGFAVPAGQDKSKTLTVGNLSGKVKEEEIASLFGSQQGFRQMQVGYC